MALRRWQGGPLLGQKLDDCSSLIRLLSTAFSRPGFLLLLPICLSARPPKLVEDRSVRLKLTIHTNKKFSCFFFNQAMNLSFVCWKRMYRWETAPNHNDTHTAWVTAVTCKDGGKACREMRERMNPHTVAFPLWICARLNFSKGRRQGAIGHSVNVSGSERPEPRQPHAVACHSLCLCLGALYFLLSPHFSHLSPFSQNLHWTQIHSQPLCLVLLSFIDRIRFVQPSFISS